MRVEIFLVETLEESLGVIIPRGRRTDRIT